LFFVSTLPPEFLALALSNYGGVFWKTALPNPPLSKKPGELFPPISAAPFFFSGLVPITIKFGAEKKAVISRPHAPVFLLSQTDKERWKCPFLALIVFKIISAKCE